MVTNRPRAITRELWHSFSTGGLLLGTLFFAASQTPSLLADFFDAGRAFGMLSRGRIRHRHIRQLALDPHGAHAAQRPLLARRQARHCDRLRNRRIHLPLARSSMAEFDP